MRKRMTVKPVPQISVNEKRFKRVIDTPKKIDIENIEIAESSVIIDLNNGVTSSLINYIIKKREITDKAILLNLVYMLLGDVEHTKYMLLPIEHPNLPAKRGRKPKLEPVLTARELSHLEFYDAEFAISSKHIAALEFAADARSVSARTIETAVRKRRMINKREAKKVNAADINQRFQEVLENLKSRKSEER